MQLSLGNDDQLRKCHLYSAANGNEDIMKWFTDGDREGGT